MPHKSTIPENPGPPSLPDDTHRILFPILCVSIVVMYIVIFNGY